MSAADPFRQGSVPPSLPLMSWWSSLHFCQDQSLFFATAEAARADMKRIIAIVMHCDARMLKLAMLNGLKLWIMNMNISQCITHPQHPRIPWGPMPCRWSWCSLEPSWFGTWSPQWHNGIPLLAWSLHFRKYIEGYWTINFQAFSSAGPSQLVVPARARKFHFGSLHRQLEVKKHRMPDKISLILFRLFWSCTKNFDSPAVAGLFTDCNTWGLERLDSYPSRGGMQHGTLSDLKWEASKLVTQVVHRQTNQVCFSLKCLSSQLACWFSLLF